MRGGGMMRGGRGDLRGMGRGRGRAGYPRGGGPMMVLSFAIRFTLAELLLSISQRCRLSLGFLIQYNNFCFWRRYNSN